jgi:hypothetical protein
MMTATAMKISESESQGFGPVVQAREEDHIRAGPVDDAGLLRMNPTSARSGYQQQ